MATNSPSSTAMRELSGLLFHHSMCHQVDDSSMNHLSMCHQEVILSVTNPLSSRGLSGMYSDLWIPGKIVLTPSTELVQSKSNFQFPI